MAIIPAMTTGMIDFIISSGRITAIAAIPVPDFAVPYAAPSAEHTDTQKMTHGATKSATEMQWSGFIGSFGTSTL